MTEKEWLKSSFPILELDWGRGWPSPRKQRLFAVACCRRIEHLWPESRLWNCLAVAERYADRKARRAELAAARPKSPDHSRNGATYAHMRRYFIRIAALWACETKMRRYAGQLAPAAACAAAYAALPQDERYVPPAESRHSRRWSAAEDQERAAQIALVYEVCCKPFRPVPAFDRAWRTSTVIALASQMYESRDFGAMPILADALQDAGCDNDDILDHCRGEGPHVRGCWVVDLVLGKE